MPSKTCLNHKEAEAVAQCHQCHKPVCKKCLVVQGEGKFCSTECAAKNKSFKESYKEPKLAGPGIISQVVGVVIGLAILDVLIYLGVRFLGLGFLAPVDFVGKFLGK